VFVVGDLAAATSRGAPVPAVATAAIQMGSAAAANVVATLAGRVRAPFRYRDKGSMAVVGRHKAVVQLGRLRFAGRPACALWAFVHLYFLIGARNRMRVFTSWIYALTTHGRGDRIITGTTGVSAAAAPTADAPAHDTHHRLPHRQLETATPHASRRVVGSTARD
jgi:NADH dehydrogenase